MSGHTPGPWWDEDGVVYGKLRSDVVAEVAKILGYPDEEEGANARLIAAAPELLEAAKALTEALRRYGGVKTPEQTMPMYALEKAITKAEERE